MHHVITIVKDFHDMEKGCLHKIGAMGIFLISIKIVYGFVFARALWRRKGR